MTWIVNYSLRHSYLIEKGLRMSSVPDSATAGNARWTRAVMVVFRLALLVFLVWALVSARFPENTPVAEDSPAPSQNSRTIADPCSAQPHELG